jgi:peptide/nickel transport system ATP-binding protein
MILSTPVLEIKNLYVNFKVFEGTLRVLNGVNFYIKAGERVGLIGESGSGKTTMMKSILRILPTPPAKITKGEILFKGKDILKMNKRELRKVREKSISMIFQDPSAALNPVFTIGTQLYDVIKFARLDKKKKVRKNEIKEIQIDALKNVALADPERILENYPIQLSGGMKQRIAIATALLSSNELILADEPGTSLDVTIKDQILRLIYNLINKERNAMILVSHALGTLKNMTERIYVMYAGDIVEVASTEELFNNPLHPYTRGLIEAVPSLNSSLGFGKPIEGSTPSYISPPFGCRFFPRCKKAMDICKEKKPSMRKINSKHEVACFLYEGGSQVV